MVALFLAEILPGTYTGKFVGGCYEVDINAPKGSFNGSGFEINNPNNDVYGKNDVSVEFGIRNPAICSSFSLAVFTPADAKSVDKKMDNSDPEEGKIVARNGVGVSGCVSSGNYQVSNADTVCRLHMWLDE